MDLKLKLLIYLVTKFNWVVDAISMFYQREYLTPKSVRINSSIFITICVFNLHAHCSAIVTFFIFGFQLRSVVSHVLVTLSIYLLLFSIYWIMELRLIVHQIRIYPIRGLFKLRIFLKSYIRKEIFAQNRLIRYIILKNKTSVTQRRREKLNNIGLLHEHDIKLQQIELPLDVLKCIAKYAIDKKGYDFQKANLSETSFFEYYTSALIHTCFFMVLIITEIFFHKWAKCATMFLYPTSILLCIYTFKTHFMDDTQN